MVRWSHEQKGTENMSGPMMVNSRWFEWMENKVADDARLHLELGWRAASYAEATR